MIGWLSGEVRYRDPQLGEVIIDVSGVGYQVTVSWQTMTEVPEVGETCSLWIHTHVREDVLSLFGFATLPEKRMFRMLTAVPQVGPKNAIGVLGGFPLPELVEAIASGERATLQRIPGVGKRTAERILLDLRDKVAALSVVASPDTPGQTEPGADGQYDEARAVLVNLGWKAKAVDTALEKAAELAPEETGDLDGLVRRALAVLMAR